METDFGMNRNKSDWRGMNFNPKLLPGEDSEIQYPHGYKSSCPGVRILGGPVSAQRPSNLPSAKNCYKHYIYIILFTRSFY